MELVTMIRTKSATENNLDLREDDYYKVWDHFSTIYENKSWRVLPAGIESPASPPQYFHPEIYINSSDELHTYNSDVRGRLDYVKKEALPFFSALFGRQVEKDCITLFPSSTQAILSIILAYKKRGVKNIILEAPCYFGGIYQSLFLDMNIYILLTSEEESYEFGVDSIDILSSVDTPFILMLTEPKFAIGTKRDRNRLKELLLKMPKNSCVIIDEAPDLDFGERDDYINALSTYNGDLYRIRGLTKGLALNGVKVSIILHNRKMKSALSSAHDTISGSLDTYSLKYLIKISSSPSSYSDMLLSAKKTISQNHTLLKRMITNPAIIPYKIESGYFGLIKIDLGAKGDFTEKRWALLEQAKKHSLPLVTGASLYMPNDYRHEWIRINYFLSKSEIIESARALDDLLTHYQQVIYTKFF